jgi:hypothetical protein
MPASPLGPGAGILRASLTAMDDETVWSEFHFARLQHKPARDAIRQAVADAKAGPVWLVNREGRRVGAIVTEQDAAFLREMRESLRAAETGQTVDLGSFAGDA